VRAEQGDTHLAIDDGLPLVGVRMPNAASASRRAQAASSPPAIPLEIGNCVTVALLAVAVADDLAVRFLQREFESRQILAREGWVRNIVHETRIATGGQLGCAQRRQ
jgi:hypothetical protein